MQFRHNPIIASRAEFDAAQIKYPFLAKRILQEYPQDILINFYPLREELRATTDPWGTDFGMYFEYLPTGTSIGINANNQFYAASLFKVPVVMAYYHGRERMHTKEDPVLTIREEDLDSEFGNLWKKGSGTKIKASEAVRLSLEESDNTAIKALLPLIMEEDFKAVYHALDIDLHTGQDGALVSARTYSSILKALHFSSVLNKDDSNEILDMLTHTKFPDKLKAGVPNDIMVAHKIGNFKVQNKEIKAVEGFRDCGIVYVPKRSYILCMFSVGDEQAARDRMKLVSEKVYEYVSTVEK